MVSLKWTSPWVIPSHESWHKNLVCPHWTLYNIPIHWLIWEYSHEMHIFQDLKWISIYFIFLYSNTFQNFLLPWDRITKMQLCASFCENYFFSSVLLLIPDLKKTKPKISKTIRANIENTDLQKYPSLETVLSIRRITAQCCFQ